MAYRSRRANSFLRLRSSQVGRGARRGTATIELAIILPVLMWLAMGMAEFGQYFYIKTRE